MNAPRCRFTSNHSRWVAYQSQHLARPISPHSNIDVVHRSLRMPGLRLAGWFNRGTDRRRQRLWIGRASEGLP